MNLEQRKTVYSFGVFLALFSFYWVLTMGFACLCALVLLLLF